MPWWVMMIAIAMIVLPQWRDRERVTFPLLEVQKAISSAPAAGRGRPGIFRDPLLAGLLQWLCSFSVKWPFHPLGLLLISTWTGAAVWFSVFVGCWLLNVHARLLESLKSAIPR